MFAHNSDCKVQHITDDGNLARCGRAVNRVGWTKWVYLNNRLSDCSSCGDEEAWKQHRSEMLALAEQQNLEAEQKAVDRQRKIALSHALASEIVSLLGVRGLLCEVNNQPDGFMIKTLSGGHELSIRAHCAP